MLCGADGPGNHHGESESCRHTNERGAGVIGWRKLK